MKIVAAGLVVGMIVTLAGCATPDPKAQAEAVAAAPAARAVANNAVGGEAPMTGSRMRKRTATERTSRAVGSSDASEAAPRAPEAGGG